MTLVSSAALLASLSLVAGALAWAPKQDIKAVRKGPDAHQLIGKNTIGALDVSIAKDKSSPESYSGTGKNGDNKVSLSIVSSGPDDGWKLSGTNGPIMIDLRARAHSASSIDWTVTGKVGDRKIDEKFTPSDDQMPPIVAALIAFDM